ncbi:DNA cytosine methyltransferase [Micromonospora rifamycinica]
MLTAGFPCQDISNAGKRAGITEAHSSVGIRAVSMDVFVWHHPVQ